MDVSLVLAMNSEVISDTRRRYFLSHTGTSLLVSVQQEAVLTRAGKRSLVVGAQLLAVVCAFFALVNGCVCVCVCVCACVCVCVCVCVCGMHSLQ